MRISRVKLFNKKTSLTIHIEEEERGVLTTISFFCEINFTWWYVSMYLRMEHPYLESTYQCKSFGVFFKIVLTFIAIPYREMWVLCKCRLDRVECRGQGRPRSGAINRVSAGLYTSVWLRHKIYRYFSELMTRSNLTLMWLFRSSVKCDFLENIPSLLLISVYFSLFPELRF